MTENLTCPNCGKPLVERTGKYGTFYGCSGYPECNYIKKKETGTTTKTTTTKKVAAKTKDPNTTLEEFKKIYDEVVAAFAQDYPESISNPEILQAIAATVFIEKNKRY